jgi:hypothetical protein
MLGSVARHLRPSTTIHRPSDERSDAATGRTYAATTPAAGAGAV